MVMVLSGVTVWPVVTAPTPPSSGPLSRPSSTESQPIDGDGWVTDADGVQRWGRYGAAGLLLRSTGGDGAPVVLLQRRAVWSDHGGTWGLPGGARNRDETVEQAALREVQEETGLHSDQFRVDNVLETARARGIDWTYSTVIADTPYPLTTEPNGEGELQWVRVDAVAELPLHPEFAAGWEGSRTQLEDHPVTPGVERAGIVLAATQSADYAAGMLTVVAGGSARTARLPGSS